MNIKTRELQLTNGTKVLYTRKPGDPFFSMAIGVNVGKVNEDNSNRGISHFIEHMCFNGTEKYTKDEIVDIPYMCGGSFNASTSEILTQYTIQHLKEFTEEAVDLLSQLVLYPTFPEEYMEKEKGIVIEELRGCKDNNFNVAFDLFNSMNEDDRLKHPIIGYEEIIKSFTREDILGYYIDYYNTNNLVISICTDMEDEELLELLEEYIPYEEGEAVGQLQFNTEADYYKTGFKDNIQQGILIHKIPLDREDLIIAEVLNFIYGDGMNSRLFSRLREEKSLCYDVGSYVDTLYNSNGLYTYISFSDFDKNLEIINEIDSILLQITEDLRDEEVEMAKIQTKRNMLLEAEKSSRLAFEKPELYFNGETLNSEDYVKKIEKVTKEDVIDLVERIVKYYGSRQIAFLNTK